jgi:hypothetical protein
MKVKLIISLFLLLNGYCLLSQERIIVNGKKSTIVSDDENYQTDTLQLTTGWRWISFPRLERYAFADDPVHPVPIMMKTNLYDDYHFTLWGQPQGSSPFKHFDSNLPNPWSGILYEVRSTLGYKYEIPASGLPLPPNPTQTLTGARIYPECPVPLPASGQEKWIGYFIEEAQYPWDAFPSNIYNGEKGLTKIQAQYWTMEKITTPAGGWGWVISGKVKPIKYGDMVIIRYIGSQASFIWTNPDTSEDDIVIPQPQAYSWEEKADYIPFYIETDSLSEIAEIAVMVDGECMGATVRQASDTLVEVDGYLGELPAGAIVDFETWNGLKSTPVERNGYVVYNPSTQKKVKRNIYVGEKQDYYMVSFKSGEVYDKPDDVSNITCIPNPFSKEMTITMQLNSDQYITAEIYTINGEKIKTLMDGDLPGGYYEVKWNGDNDSGNKVMEGVYFYKIRTANGTEISEKIVLIN